MIDIIVEWIVILGGVLKGILKVIVEGCSWNDYELGKGLVFDYFKVLDVVYDGVNGDYRKVLEFLGEIDLVLEDMIIG